MTQSNYLISLLKNYNMDTCKPRSTPCEMKISSNESGYCNGDGNYREMVGSLIYAMICSCPDLCYAVIILSQHLVAPTKNDWILLKNVLRYIFGT